MEDCAQFLKNRFPDLCLESPCSWKKHTTVGCGGDARAGVFPRSFTELIAVVDALQSGGYAYRVLGNGSNVLPGDGRSETAFVFTKLLSFCSFSSIPLAYAGTTAKAFLDACEECGKSGAEFLDGIPCTMGGAAYMNAGAAGRYLSEVVHSVIVYRKGELHSYLKDDCAYAYKSSRFMSDDGVILGVTFDLLDAPKEEIQEKRKFYRARRSGLPKGRSMGCVFKNPDGDSAGRLIDGAGLKGMKIGGAYVSTEHANFIINDGYATSRDVKELITVIKNAVYQQYKIRLEEEIRYLP